VKKTIASLAILASVSTASALTRPISRGQVPPPETACLTLSQNEDGSQQAGKCDMTDRNHKSRAETLESGCTEDQVAVTIVGVSIKSCPTYTQL
jgi:hypothetical protein